MNLEQYKELLDKNTNDGLGYEDLSKSRYQSFKLCMDHLNKIENPEVLEIGTTRSYVGGAWEGCNSDDPKYWNPNDFTRWDFGAGCFSLMFGLAEYKLTTVDIAHDHIRRCKTMTDSLKLKVDHVVSDSIKFLRTTDKKFDLIYLDSGDMFPLSPSIDLQLEEAKVIVERNLLKSNGLLLIDDVLHDAPRRLEPHLNNTLGKSEKSIPYLLSNGFKTVLEGYQYILIRN